MCSKNKSLKTKCNFERYKKQKGQLIRVVKGKEIIQIEEKTQSDIDKNERINNWRMRNN